MRGRSVLAVAIGLLGMICLHQKPLSGQIGLQEVTSLRFEGNRQFSDEALANAILTRETECKSFVFAPFCWAGAEFSLDPYFLSEREFRRDHARVRLFYYLRGFREAAVDTVLFRSVENEVEITFQIEEGDPIRVTEVAVQGLEDLADSTVVENLPIRVGEAWSMIGIDATKDTLENRLKNRGYPYADVLSASDHLSETPYEAQVWFDVDPGPLTRFGPLSVTVTSADAGREPTMEETVVRRMLPFKEGDLYGENLLFSGQRNLYNLDIFRSVRIVPDSSMMDGRASTAEDTLPVRVTLVEGDIRRVRTGGGLNTAECFNVEAGWGSRNFLGGARRLQLRGRVANILAPELRSSPLCSKDLVEEYGDYTWSISADFTQPWFFSPRNSLSAGLFFEHQSVAPIFVREAVGASLAVDRTIAEATVLGFSFRPQRTSLTAAEVFYCSAYLICDPDDIVQLGAENYLSPVAVSLSRDRRNQLLSPTRGYSAGVDLEHAGRWSGSDFRYTRVISQATWHTEVPGQWVLGARLRGGWVIPGGFKDLIGDEMSSEIVNPEKRLFGGGSNSVRGFAQNRLGPRVLYLERVERLLGSEAAPGPCTPQEVVDKSCDASGLVADDENAFFPSPTGGTRLVEGSLEVRFPLAGRLWEGATFLDFGQVWDQNSTLTLGDLELTPGLGVRFFSPIGPIRVDVAYRFGGGESLAVVTQAIETYDPDLHSPKERLPEPYENWARPGELIVLANRVWWEDDLGAFSLKRFQIHLSIGQAF